MTSGIIQWPTELIERILSFVQPEHHDKEVGIDRRKHLSVESFEPAPDRSRGSIGDVGSFRLVCNRFEEIGRPVLFTRVTTRFSARGLKTLQSIAASAHLACLVERFTYLVPYFYDDEANDLDALSEDLQRTGLRNTEIDSLRRKRTEQRTICSNEDDVSILKQSIAKFTKLKLVQLLRVADSEDRMLLGYLSRHEDARSVLNLDWSRACSHAARTIITALLTSINVPWSRFSLLQLSPESAQYLSTLAERLEVLTLHFDDKEGLDANVQELSAVFKQVFTRARNMRAVHVGFPSHRPLTVPLTTVFRDVRWEKLVAFGVHGWELGEDEIFDMVRRHPGLRGLRLRDVHLKEGSLWRNVLQVLRSEMYELQWVSLRRIGYTQYYHSPQFSQDAGIELPDFHELSQSSEEEEEEEEEDAEERADEAAPSGMGHDRHGPGDGGGEDGDDERGDDDESLDDSDDEHGPEAHGVDFPNLNSPATPASAPWCTCSGGGGRLESAEELDDDGLHVDNRKRKCWERWALRRCPEHGER